MRDVRVAAVERRAGIQWLQLFKFRNTAAQPQLACVAFSFQKTTHSAVASEQWIERCVAGSNPSRAAPLFRFFAMWLTSGARVAASQAARPRGLSPVGARAGQWAGFGRKQPMWLFSFFYFYFRSFSFFSLISFLIKFKFQFVFKFKSDFDQLLKQGHPIYQFGVV